MLDDAKRLELIATNPADAVELPKAVKKEIKVILDDDQNAFTEAIRGHALENLFVVAMHTGARMSEVLGMTWKNIKLDNGEIKINAQLQRARTEDMKRTLVSTKTNNHRTVIVPQFVVDALRDEKRKQAERRIRAGELWDNDLGLVFTREDGSPIPHTTVSNAFKRITTSIGRPDLSFHALRHTYATEEIASGTDPKTVASTLGHSTVQMTMDVYATAVSETKKASAERRQQQFAKGKNISG
jgi:integrase